MDSVQTIIKLLRDLADFFRLLTHSRASLAAENLFLRKQLAMFQERKAKPRRADTPLRITLVLLSRLFNWRDALVVVQPKHLSDGTVRAFACSGAGNHALDDHRYP